MIAGIPILKQCLTFILVSLFGLSITINPYLVPVEIISYNGHYYEGKINGEFIFIELSSSDSDEIEINDDNENEKHYEKPGKIKITFRDSKDKGTTLIYERDMEDGEISDVDQIYIEKILASIHKFHRENRTINDRVKDFFNSVFSRK